MSTIYCGVCDRDWFEHCDCEVIAAKMWTAAKAAWTEVRATLPPTPHQRFLDGMFFAGEECPAMPAPPTADRGEDSCG